MLQKTDIFSEKPIGFIKSLHSFLVFARIEASGPVRVFCVHPQHRLVSFTNGHLHAHNSANGPSRDANYHHLFLQRH
jgi:hypothetical protein